MPLRFWNGSGRKVYEGALGQPTGEQQKPDLEFGVEGF